MPLRFAAVAKRWVAVPVLLMAGVILVAGLPRTFGAFVSGSGEPILRHIQKQEDVTLDDLQTVIDAQSQGLFWTTDASMETKQGLAHLLIAEKLAATDPARDLHIQTARQTLRASLGRSPANPYPWTLLAYAEFLDSGKWSPPAIDALRMATLTGPYEPRILWSRLRLAMKAWDALNTADRDLVLQQIRFAWVEDPKALTQLAIDLKAANIVRAALLADQDASSAFETALKDQTTTP